MDKLELKPTFTADGVLLLSIFCGAFIAFIVFISFFEHGSPLIGLITAIVLFIGIVYGVGFKMARKQFPTVKIMLDGNLMTVYKHGEIKDIIEISNINQVIFIENTVHHYDIKDRIQTSYTHRYLTLTLKSGLDYKLILDGFRLVWTESLVSYITRHNKDISLQRIKLVDGNQVPQT